MSLRGETYRSVLWPLYEAGRRRRTHGLLRDAERNQWKTQEELAALQWAEVQKLLAHAYECSIYYRRIFERLGVKTGDITSWEEFRQLPILTKDDICEHREELLASRFRGRRYEHKTGGSTGVPLRFYVNYGSYEWRRAMTLRGYRWAGYEEGERTFYLWGAPIDRGTLRQRIKASLRNALLREKVIDSFHLSEGVLRGCVEEIHAFRPRTIIGYTNALYILAEYMIDNKIAAPKPRGVISAAEAVDAMQRQVIERAFGAPVFASYGSREFMLIATECERHEGLHVSCENLLLEVVVDGRAAREGEMGEILVTDLHNYAMPFIRYRIGDLGIATTKQCPCGRGLAMLAKVEGRIVDAIRTSDGRIIHGEFFPHLMKEFASVKQFQVVQKQKDSLRIKLVLREGDHTGELAKIEQEVSKIIGERTTVVLERVGEIPPHASGKVRVTVSEL